MTEKKSFPLVNSCYIRCDSNVVVKLWLVEMYIEWQIQDEWMKRSKVIISIDYTYLIDRMLSNGITKFNSLIQHTYFFRFIFDEIKFVKGNTETTWSVEGKHTHSPCGQKAIELTIDSQLSAYVSRLLEAILSVGLLKSKK